jgi:CTP synthase (UTP-ammonia lyase)
MAQPRIGIIGDFSTEYISHRETGEAITVAAARLSLDVGFDWVPTDKIAARGADAALSAFDGFWAAPGSPYRSLEGALGGIRYARENGKPLVGT